MTEEKANKGLSRLAEFSLRKPVTITMIFISLVTVGLISSRLLPLESFPEMKLPFFNVFVPYQAATPAEVERSITRPLEEALATIGDIEGMNSNSSTNGANINIQFSSDIDVDEKGMLIREQIDLTRPELPEDVRYINVNKAQAGNGGDTIMNIRITGDLDFTNAYDVLNQYLVRPVERVPGVARADLQGIEPLELRIKLDAERMRRYGIGFNELSSKLNDANFAIKSGNFLTEDQVIRITPKSRATDVDDYKNLVLNENNIRLQDVAAVELVNGERNYARHLDRKYSVGLEIYKESTANMVTVADAVLARIDELKDSPQMKGIQLIFLDNQAQGVKDSLRDVIQAGLVGSLLSLVVLFFFLRNASMTLMISLSIPISIIITLGAMYFLGISLNILSLMGLMLAVGMLVDNSVVVTESIFTQQNEHYHSGNKAIVNGVKQVLTPVIAGTLTSICVFLPIIFREEGLLSTFLTHVAVAIVVALLVSLAISITVMPLMVSKFANRLNVEEKVGDKGFIFHLRRKYESVLKYTLAHRWHTFFFIVVLIAIGFFAQSQMKSDEGAGDNVERDFWLPYHVRGSYTLERLKKDVDIIEDYLYANQERFEIKSVYSYYQEDGFVASKIDLVPEEEATKSVAEIKKEIMEGLPKIAIGNPSFRWRSSIGNQGLNVYLLGDSHEILREDILPDVLLSLQRIEAVTNAQVEQRNKKQEIQITVDRERAIQLGLSPTEVAQTVNIAMRGMNLRDYLSETGELPVTMRFFETNAFDIQMLRKLPIKNDAGISVDLENVADIQIKNSPQNLFRYNRSSSIRIEVDLLPDTNVSDTKEEIEGRLNALNYPSGYSWSFERSNAGFDIDASDLIQNIIIAICLIFIIMAALFESLLFPLSVITSILFSYLGTWILFAITGTTFTIMAAIGMLILIGVIVNNGIVLIDHINQLRASGLNRYDAVIQGGKDRLRPILMTVATTVVGLLPLSISTSQVGGGGPAYFPMARAIIGGLTFSTIISLLVLPSFYCWLDDLRSWGSNRLKQTTIYPDREEETTATAVDPVFGDDPLLEDGVDSTTAGLEKTSDYQQENPTNT